MTRSTLPAAPTGLSAVFHGTQLTISWTAPAENPAGTITGYEYQTRAPGGTASTVWGGLLGDTTSITIGRVLYEGHDIRVRAETDGGAGTWSRWLDLDRPVPAPTGLSATFSATQITISWTPPENPPGTITGYEYQTRAPDGIASTVWGGLSGDTTSITIGRVLYEGHDIRVRAESNGEVALWSEWLPLVRGSPATGAPSISGTAQVGQTLTAGAGTIADADGLTGVSYSWQWVRVESGGAENDIAGATGMTYMPVAADVGRTLKVRASFTDDAGNAESRTSGATATVTAAGTPTITLVVAPNPVREGSSATVTATVVPASTAATTLTVSAAPASGANAAEGGDFTLTGATLTIAADAMASTGAVTIAANQDDDEDDERVTVSAAVTAGGLAASAAVTLTITDDDGTPPPPPPPPPPGTNQAATGTPVITGTARVGETLTAGAGDIADADGLTGVSYSWQWVRVESDGTEADISGATSATYTPVAADVGRTLKVRASFTDDAGNAEALTSAATAPVTAAPTGPAVHRIGLFPAAARRTESGYQGFARIINRSDEAGEVRIEAFDDAGVAAGPVTLDIEAGETVHFNSDDLEEGNPDKGLSDGVGDGTGNWRLALASTLDLRVLGYIRTDDGFVTSMHDVAPETEGVHRVVFFNPGSNTSQVSGLRLVNSGEAVAEVTIEGIDDDGESPGEAVMVEVPAGAAETLTAQALESGEGLSGGLGDGAGKWRLMVSADAPIEVMSLLATPTGHLTNLSTAPGLVSSVEPGD